MDAIGMRILNPCSCELVLVKVSVRAGAVRVGVKGKRRKSPTVRNLVVTFFFLFDLVFGFN